MNPTNRGALLICLSGALFACCSSPPPPVPAAQNAEEEWGVLQRSHDPESQLQVWVPRDRPIHVNRLSATVSPDCYDADGLSPPCIGRERFDEGSRYAIDRSFFDDSDPGTGDISLLRMRARSVIADERLDRLPHLRATVFTVRGMPWEVTDPITTTLRLVGVDEVVVRVVR